MDIAQNDSFDFGPRFRVFPQERRNSVAGIISAFDTVRNRNVSLVELSRGDEKEQKTRAYADRAERSVELDHISLVNVWDIFSKNERVFLVVEPVEARSLIDLLSKPRTPALSNILKWADDLFDVLIYLHTRPEPFIHGDISPRNVWLTLESRIKLNYPALMRSSGVRGNGAAKHESDLPFRSLESLWHDLDKATKLVISKGFDDAPYDELLGSAEDERSDIYGLSATLYYALTRVVPADAMTRTVDILEGRSDPVQPVCQLNTDVSESISNVIMKGFAVKRAERFETAYDMRTALVAATGKHFDDLTRLPNESQFTTHLWTAIAEISNDVPGKFSVMILEIDDVDEIYERFGRLIGDELVLQAAERLASSVRINDVVGRISRDRFALLLFESGSVDDVKRIASRVQSRVAESQNIDNCTVLLTSRVGLSFPGSEDKGARQFIEEAASLL